MQNGFGYLRDSKHQAMRFGCMRFRLLLGFSEIEKCKLILKMVGLGSVTQMRGSESGDGA